MTVVNSSPASVTQGSVQRTTGQREESATENPTPVQILDENGELQEIIFENRQTAPPAQKKDGPYTFPNVITNSLEKFSSFNVLFTMISLTKEEFNNPLSYRGNLNAFRKESIVFASAGRYDDQRVGIVGGIKPEYFVNNFQMFSTVAPTEDTGNSNAISFSFEIFEPYSMGQFLQSLQNAAIKAKHINYLNNAPYCLKIDFQGYDGTGSPSKTKITKYFTVKLRKVTFNVTESGSNYKVDCVPYNFQGFSNVINRVYKDVAIVGSTVKEVLTTGERSLSSMLNDEQNQLYKDGKIGVPDEYIIVYPKTASDTVGVTQNASPLDRATANVINGQVNVEGRVLKQDFETGQLYDPATYSFVNRPNQILESGISPIGDASLGFDVTSGGNYVFLKENEAYDEKTGVIKRDQLSIDVKSRTFQFAQGQSITNIITAIVTNSQYCIDALKPEKINGSGEVVWFKIDVQFQFLSWDPKRNEYAKRIIYRIIPYETHSSKLQNPTEPAKGYKNLTKKIAKKYEYIYSGQNTDIIKFELKFDNMFFNGSNPQIPVKSANVVDAGRQQVNADTEVKTEQKVGSQATAVASKTGTPSVQRDETREKSIVDGSSGEKSVEQIIAETFQNAFTKGGDFVKADLEILGDPYFLVDSGIANYFSPAGSSAVDGEGGMTYLGSDVYIYVTFRTPSDVDPAGSGLMKLPAKDKLSPFSGIFRIRKVETKISDGVFKQTLQLARMPGQPTDYDTPPPDGKAANILIEQPAGEVQPGITTETAVA